MSLGTRKMSGVNTSESVMETSCWAHSQRNEQTGALRVHGLVEHLDAVGRLAHGFAAGWGAEFAELAGRWHDLGKFRPGFQRYIRQTGDAHLEGRLPAASDKSHSAAGALHALASLRHAYGQTGERLAKVLA